MTPMIVRMVGVKTPRKVPNFPSLFWCAMGVYASYIAFRCTADQRFRSDAAFGGSVRELISTGVCQGFVKTSVERCSSIRDQILQIFSKARPLRAVMFLFVILFSRSCPEKFGAFSRPWDRRSGRSWRSFRFPCIVFRLWKRFRWFRGGSSGGGNPSVPCPRSGLPRGSFITVFQ